MKPTTKKKAAPKPKKFKYVNTKKRPNYDLYLRFETGVPKKVTLSSWKFEKDGISGALFKGYICKEDGKKVDKIWSIWDYAFVQVLKKKFAGKKPTDEMEVNVIVKENDDGESYYELSK